MKQSEEEILGAVLTIMLGVFGTVGIGLFLWGAGRHLLGI